MKITTINRIRIRIVFTLALFVSISAFIYFRLGSIHQFHKAVLLGIGYLGLVATTTFSLYWSFRELRQWKKLLAAGLSLLLASLMPNQCEAMVATFPLTHEDGTVENVMIGRIGKDRVIYNQDGTFMRDANGNKLVVLGNNGLGAIDSNGNLTVPNVTLCEFLGGMIVIGVGTIIVVGIAKCAKRCLNPPTNSPPTNKPPSEGGDIFPQSGKRFKTQQPMMGSDSSGLGWDTTVAVNGWVDWTGSPITGSFGGCITNMYLTNLDGTVSTMAYKSSLDLKLWHPEYICVTGWVSQTPAMTNMTTITYDQYGNPFATNWYSSFDNSVSAIHGPPIRSGARMGFYEVSP